MALRKCSFKQTAEKILLSAAAAIHLPENWIQGITSFPAWNDISFLTWIFCFWERFWVRSHLAPAEPDLKFPLWSSTGTTKPLSPTSSFQEPAPKSLSFTPKKLDCNVKQISNVPLTHILFLNSHPTRLQKSKIKLSIFIEKLLDHEKEPFCPNNKKSLPTKHNKTWMRVCRTIGNLPLANSNTGVNCD